MGVRPPGRWRLPLGSGGHSRAAVYFLAKADGNPGSTRRIAAELGISYKHLTRVMQRLTRAGLLRR